MFIVVLMIHHLHLQAALQPMVSSSGILGGEEEEEQIRPANPADAFGGGGGATGPAPTTEGEADKKKKKKRKSSKKKSVSNDAPASEMKESIAAAETPAGVPERPQQVVDGGKDGGAMEERLLSLRSNPTEGRVGLLSKEDTIGSTASLPGESKAKKKRNRKKKSVANDVSKSQPSLLLGSDNEGTRRWTTPAVVLYEGTGQQQSFIMLEC